MRIKIAGDETNRVFVLRGNGEEMLFDEKFDAVFRVLFRAVEFIFSLNES